MRLIIDFDTTNGDTHDFIHRVVKAVANVNDNRSGSKLDNLRPRPASADPSPPFTVDVGVVSDAPVPTPYDSDAVEVSAPLGDDAPKPITAADLPADEPVAPPAPAKRGPGRPRTKPVPTGPTKEDVRAALQALHNATDPKTTRALLEEVSGANTMGKVNQLQYAAVIAAANKATAAAKKKK